MIYLSNVMIGRVGRFACTTLNSANGLVRCLSSQAIPTSTVVKHPYSLNSSPGASSAKFAIINMNGKQYKVTTDDTIVVDNMSDVDIDQTVLFEQVLLVGSQSETIVGRPYVSNATVTATVEEIAKDKKVYAFHMRRRKNSQRMRAFRRQVTILRITDINSGSEK